MRKKRSLSSGLSLAGIANIEVGGGGGIVEAGQVFAKERYCRSGREESFVDERCLLCEQLFS